ncbi:hypothetical protein BDN72DRAFT_487938 [Pluteus cervinus]|uniref:Uncharacterized protein n=1 Tax=Pluteus cervinus TaxID=181527 RepID=A0ACD3B0L3_9AGAR|nr:hypothetical protein BDN72DRAFT_487938 [Pluteus cervinus]
MQFPFKFIFFASALVGSLTIPPVNAAPSARSSSAIATREQLNTWITRSGTASNLTIVDRPIAPIAFEPFPKRQDFIQVVFCNKQTDGTCGGACSVYDGPSVCLNATGTSCVLATYNVQFCSSTNCDGTCNSITDCGDTLEDGSCFIPGTTINSIFVP